MRLFPSRATMQWCAQHGMRPIAADAVAGSVYVSVCPLPHMIASRTKMAEPIEMQFGIWGPKNQRRLFDGSAHWRQRANALYAAFCPVGLYFDHL